MALLNCQECGNEVSTKAKICPRCGAKAPKEKLSFLKRMLAILCVGFWACVIYSYFQEHNPVYSAVASISSNNPSSSTRYKLNNADLAILNIMLKDNIDDFSKGDESILRYELLSATTVEVEIAYNQNQVAADQKYYKNKIFISGIIQEIKSGIGNEPYITFYGINQFLSAQARFQVGNTEKIAALNKGQKLNLVCISDGAILGSPQFRDCQFTEDYAVNRVSEVRSEISDFLNGNKTSELAEVLTILTIAYEKGLPATSTCFTDGSKCAADIMVVDKNTDIQQRMNAVADELESLGIQVKRKKTNLT